MSHWRVDPDGVLRALAGVDEAGVRLAVAERRVLQTVTDGRAVLARGGRTRLMDAWNTFVEDRQHVPGRLMNVLQASAGAVSAAAVAVATGGAQMADNVQARERYALDAWGIRPAWEYGW